MIYPIQGEIIQAFTGGTARAGVGLDILDDISEDAVRGQEGTLKDLKNLMNTLYKTIGNFFNTFIVGGGMLKDVAATVLPADYTTVQDNTDVDMMEYMFKQAARSKTTTVRSRRWRYTTQDLHVLSL